jgi:hypothetical protein
VTTHRLDLYNLYPYLGYLTEVCVFEKLDELPPHPALRHQITNYPVPEAAPDGTEANLICLGDELSPEDLMSA